VQDFYTLMSHGVFLTALGNSDTHHLNNILAGFPRTYVRVADTRTEPFDEAGFVASLRARRAIATTGPWLDVKIDGTAGPGDQVTNQTGSVDVIISLRQASYVHATRVRILVGDKVQQTLPVAPGQTSFDFHGRVPIGTTDTWIGVDASGDDPLPPDLVGDYISAVAKHPGMLPFALINPVLIDADGDGHVTLSRRARASGEAPPPRDFAAPKVIPHAERGPYDCGEATRE
jgi:hypothetical protein